MTPPTFFYPDTPDVPLPDGHRFPASKYRLLREQVVREGLLGSALLKPSPTISRDQLLVAHDAAYVDAVLEGTVAPDVQRRIGLPWSATLVARSCVAVGGTLAAARMALHGGVSGQLAGGTHHAHRDFGSGFCTFNDLAVAAFTLLDAHHAQRIAILDLDVHQGDGNAAILTPDPRVFVVSVHGEKNFPFRKVASDLDIGLPDGTSDLDYLAVVDDALSSIAAFEPDLLFYLSGVDALASDTLGRLALTFDGLRERDLAVFRFANDRELPLCVVLGGGYAKPITDTVDVYANTLKAARTVYQF